MDFSLADPPPGFIDDPYPVYDALREHYEHDHAK